MALALLVLPLMAGRGAREHLALYWEGLVAPLARWVRLDEATAFWLVAGALPGGVALPAGAHLPLAGSQAGNASGTGGIWSEARAWVAWLAERLPRWMVVREFPLLGTAAIAPLSATTGSPPQGSGLPSGPSRGDEPPVPGEMPADPRPPAPVEPAGPPAAARPLTAGTEAPRVLIYHSHTSEMYRQEGEPLREASAYHRFNTVETGVVRAGRALARALEARGIAVLHDTEIYDYPSHPRAYLESGRAVAELLTRYPSIQVVIDLHRDTPADMVATVNGRRVARITLVVATAVDSGLPHSGWRENLAFAQELARVMNERTPGLLDRILQVPNRRYNQELHPHALLVEVGSYHNTQAEADAAAELFAESLAEVTLELPARPGTPGPAHP